MRQIATSTLNNQDIGTAALLAYTYTADADREIFVRLFVDQVVGNGFYVAYLTIRRLGAGSFYRVLPVTRALADSGVTAIVMTTMAIPLKNTDVMRIYIQGLAADTVTPDVTVDIWENESSILIGIPVALDSGAVTLAGMLTKLADDNVGASYDATTDSQRSIAQSVPTAQEVRDAMKLSPTALPIPAAGSVDEHLDNLPADADVQLTGTHGAGSWVDSGAPPAMITEQEVRDAMKLAPTALPIPAAGSVDEHLDDTLTDIAALNDLSAADAADAVWDEATAGHVAAGSFGKWAADLLARVGTFTGTGANTVLGFLRAMMRKDLAAPSDVGGTYLPSTDSLEAQSEQLAGFVSSAVVTFISALAGGLVTIYRDCDLQINFTGLGPIALSDEIYFTVKFAGKLINLDTDAVLLVKRTAGLVYVCKHSPIAASNGSLTVTDAVLGNITVRVKAVENAKLPITADLVWDVKRITAGGAVDPPLSNGTAQVLATATRSVA